MCSPKIGSTCVFTPRRSPFRTALTIARVCAIDILSPTPYGPPTQPVFSIHTSTWWRFTRSMSMSAYRSGGNTRNGAAKQVLKMGSGSVTPRSVPATLAV